MCVCRDKIQCKKKQTLKKIHKPKWTENELVIFWIVEFKKNVHWK